MQASARRAGSHLCVQRMHDMIVALQIFRDRVGGLPCGLESLLLCGLPCYVIMQLFAHIAVAENRLDLVHIIALALLVAAEEVVVALLIAMYRRLACAW